MEKVAIFDLDGTLIKKHIWTGLVKHHLKFKENRLLVFKYLFFRFGLLPLFAFRLISQKKFFETWRKNISWMLKGMDLEKIEKTFHWISEFYLLPSLNTDLLKLKKEHKENNFLTILVSGSYKKLLEILNKKLKFDFVIGTELEIKDKKATGKIIPPLCFSEGKKKKFEEFLKKENLKIDFKESFAYTDSIFDLPILNLVGNPVVINPDKDLLILAQKYGWKIIA
jgi:HAD superfamily hydrolase (TIGR01490 family)